MFGWLRYLLALLVVYGHYRPFTAGTFTWLGHYAVWAFYLLSGYLMALVLTERYAFDRGGMGRYLANRGLRIYPPYLAALLVSAAAVALAPEACRAMGPSLRWPLDAAGWIQNLAIFGLHGPQPARLIAPSWSLSVELIFYLLMGLGLARRRWLALAWFAASVGLVATTRDSGLFLVGGLRGASVCFSAGALVYYARRSRLPQPPAWLALPAGAVFLAHAFAAHLLWADVWGGGLFLSLALCALIVWSLASLRPAAVPRAFARSDRFLGDLAYPIFLCHFQVGALVVHGFFGDARPAWPLLLLVGLPFVHGVAWALHRAVEAPLVSVRDRVRHGRSPA